MDFHLVFGKGDRFVPHDDPKHDAVVVIPVAAFRIGCLRIVERRDAVAWCVRIEGPFVGEQPVDGLSHVGLEGGPREAAERRAQWCGRSE
ncbi:MAG TPA: hypothetical protein VFS66_15610 [Acidimicrobiia bacterium]|nr:hypothetical protein [Acidimicrobiia bacterium]